MKAVLFVKLHGATPGAGKTSFFRGHWFGTGGGEGVGDGDGDGPGGVGGGYGANGPNGGAGGCPGTSPGGRSVHAAAAAVPALQFAQNGPAGKLNTFQNE